MKILYIRVLNLVKKKLKNRHVPDTLKEQEVRQRATNALLGSVFLLYAEGQSNFSILFDIHNFKF